MRASIRAHVERCEYVERVDAQRQESEPSATFDSFRKHKWLQQKAVRNHAGAADLSLARETDERAAAEREALQIREQLAQQLLHAAEAMEQKRSEQERRRLEAAVLAKAGGNRRDPSVPLAFEAFLDEIQESDVDVRCSTSPLPVIPFDKLGAISVPSRREGNSLTLCCWDQDASDGGEDGGSAVVDEIKDSGESTATRKEQLVVFGGRVLQDVSKLLPAAVLKDPMKFERVRYTYSSGVYAYDIATGVWRFHECSGRAPRERSDHSAVFLAPHFLMICGGRGRNGQVFRDTFALDVRRWQWTPVDTETRIIERYWHGCCVTRESVVVFGGKSDVVTHGDLQLLDARELRDHLVSLDRKAKAAHELKPSPRPMDVYILDTVTLIWSSPRLSSHVSMRTTAPAERMLFECFYRRHTLVVFGGFTYATNGESESCTPRLDGEDPAVFKLAVNRMIWRRQVLEAPLPAPHIHASANAVLGSRAFSCAASPDHALLELRAFHLEGRTADRRDESR